MAYPKLFDDVKPKVPWDLHQCYTPPGSTRQLVCASCGATELEVGYDDWLTIVRCPKCRHEEIIHDG